MDNWGKYKKLEVDGSSYKKVVADMSEITPHPRPKKKKKGLVEEKEHGQKSKKTWVVPFDFIVTNF